MLQLFAVGLSIVIADIWIRKEILEVQSFLYLFKIIFNPDFSLDIQNRNRGLIFHNKNDGHPFLILIDGIRII